MGTISTIFNGSYWKGDKKEIKRKETRKEIHKVMATPFSNVWE